MQAKSGVECAATDNGYEHSRKLLCMRLLRIGSTSSSWLQCEQAFVGSDVVARVRRTTVTSSERVTGVIIIIVNPSPIKNIHVVGPGVIFRRNARRCADAAANAAAAAE